MNTSFLNPLRRIYHKFKSKRFTDSQTYWKNRYVEGGNSGWGSYNRLAEFKAEVINDFVRKNQVKGMIEFGCGDGNQCRLFEVNRYIGIDISSAAINANKQKFKNDRTKEFHLDGSEKNLDLSDVDVVLSLDVIYHLVEDEIFNAYMKKLFQYARRYVIIYSSDFDDKQTAHVRNRKFSNWIERNAPEWKQVAHIPNKYPYVPNAPENTSWADFYIYSQK
jgi:2-polyprenyl-3-methyl-5-hydroxy-6-metoxy-1,4-benzoquinol methylase